MLLKTTVLACVEDLLVACAMLREKALENLVAALDVHELAAHGANTGRIRAWSRIVTNEAFLGCLVWQSERACIEGWLASLCLLYNRLTEYVV